MKSPLRLFLVISAGAPALCAGCATINSKPDYEKLDQHVLEALGEPFAGRPDDEAAEAQRRAAGPVLALGIGERQPWRRRPEAPL